jgi:uncharacterized protein (TIGR02118 family)
MGRLPQYRPTDSQEADMTTKLVALWTAPDDAEGFEADYVTNHLALVQSVPGLTGAVASKAVGGPYYRMAELKFEDLEGLGAAMGSEAGLALAADSDRLQDAFGNKLDVLIVEEQ